MSGARALRFRVIAVSVLLAALSPAAAVMAAPAPGDWVGSYGADGYVLGAWNDTSDLVGLPAGVTYSLEQGARFRWASPTADMRGLQSPNQAERRAATWYDATQVRIRLNFASAYSGTLHLYAVDWDALSRLEDVTVDDGTGPRTTTLATFATGAWTDLPITVGAGGSVLITVTHTAGLNAVLSGLFLGDAATPPDPAPPSGDWVSQYGANGYVLGAWNGSSDLIGLTGGVTYAVEQASRYSWMSPTADVRALESPNQTERRAATWYDGSQVRIRLNFTNAYSGSLHLYALDWDAVGRLEDITVDDGTGPRTAGVTSSFATGAWAHFPITVAAGGSALITVSKTAGMNAVLSGLFLGYAATPTAPTAPTRLTATAGNGQVALGWRAPASSGGSPITGYTATASPGGATCTTASLGCTISGLANGTTYSFTVSAANVVGTGPASASASATPVAPATVPGAPTALNATAGNGHVVLAWTAPASNGGSPITGYTATASPGGATCTTASLGCTISGLANGTTYSFTVRAHNAVGPGPASAPDSATPVAPATVPGAPTGLSATTGPTTPGAAPTTGGSQVRLAWSAPASTGGSPLTGYKIYRGTISGGETLLAGVGLVTGYSDASAAAGSTYFYQVAALNAMGEGARSPEASVTPAVVGEAPRAPEDLKARMKADGQVRLSWSPPSRHNRSHVTGYRIYRSTSSGTEEFLVAVGNVTTYLDTTATKGVRYYYQVSAVNAAGEGPRSKERRVGQGNDGGDQGNHDGGHEGWPPSPGAGT